MNNINLIGRIVATPQIQVHGEGEKALSIAMYRLAVDRGYKDKQGNQVTDFILCKSMNNGAKFVSKYFKKGKRVAVTGSIQIDVVGKEDGGNDYFTYVYVKHHYFADGSGNSSESNESSGKGAGFIPMEEGEKNTPFF